MGIKQEGASMCMYSLAIRTASLLRVAHKSHGFQATLLLRIAINYPGHGNKVARKPWLPGYLIIVHRN